VIKFLDPAAGKEKGSLTAQYSWVTNLAFSSDGQFLASGGMNPDTPEQYVDGKKRGGVTLWNWPKETLYAKFPGQEKWVLSISFSPDSKTLAVTTCDEPVWLWDVAARKRRLSLPDDNTRDTAASFSPNGKSLATVHDGEGIRIWNLESMRVHTRLKTRCISTPIFSPDGQTIAVLGSIKAELWSVRRAERIRSFEGDEANLSALAVSPDGKLLVSGGSNGLVRIWGMETGRELAVLRGHKGCVNAVVFSPDGKILASGGGAFPGPGEVILWNVAEVNRQ
jgi:WD40 repeat protein